ncbi:substrate-binding domain-containing protein [Deinococcus oregonensis]|uniref:Substrate-binding domain-containing protein n=1 Tax=Deinococcus oregonensis TaxID=1805970 RepID=A0ABV6AXM0_9DEIO
MSLGVILGLLLGKPLGVVGGVWLAVRLGVASLGLEALKQLLPSSQRPTAAVCANDLVAAGVLMAAREYELNVPKDFSVVGFDDIFLARLVTPALTTVNHNYSELARRALDALLASIEGESPDRTINVPTFLVKRESVAPHDTHGRRRTSVKSNRP